MCLSFVMFFIGADIFQITGPSLIFARIVFWRNTLKFYAITLSAKFHLSRILADFIFILSKKV